MPNADTMGNIIREKFVTLSVKYDHVIIIENFGLQGYFSAMKHSCFLLGNTSSGIIEAASFKKYVINLGDRQKGRYSGNNVINIKIKRDIILDTIVKTNLLGEYTGDNNYRRKEAAFQQIIKALKNI